MSTRVVVATDGSAINNPNGPAGWAWYVSDGCWGAGGFPKASNQYAELFAVLAVLRGVPRELPLLIRTDSQFAINSLTKWMPGWKRNGWRKKDGQPPANLGLLRELDAALAGRAVQFEWVRGHAGDPMNERADKLCTDASAAVLHGRTVNRGPGWNSAAVPATPVRAQSSRGPAGTSAMRRTASPSSARSNAGRPAASRVVTTRVAPQQAGNTRTSAPVSPSGIRGMVPMSPKVAQGLQRPTVTTGSNFKSATSSRPAKWAEDLSLETCPVCGGKIDPYTSECRCSD